jgi:phenylacetate-CoA ligase
MSLTKPMDHAIVARQKAFLDESQTWSANKLADFQVQALRRLLVRAGATVPYYRRLFKTIRFDPDTVTSLDAIQKIPFLNKKMIVENPSDFIADDIDVSSIDYHTSGGSTGNPLRIYMDKQVRSLTHANTHYYLGVAGYEVGKSRSIRLHGNPIPDDVVRGEDYWLLEGNRLSMSIHHLSEATAARYVEMLNRHRPAYIHAYASALSMLCHYVEHLDLRIDVELDCVFCDSETLLPWQRQQFERVLGCKIYNVYGHTEGAVLGITFPQSERLHILPQIGVTEVLDSNGAEVSGNHGRGEVVVTGFNNHVMPFIRYQTNDIADIADPAEDLGLAYRQFHQVEGRVQDYIVDRDGAAIPIAPALFDYNFDWSGVDRFQIQQDRVGDICFKFVPVAGASPGEVEETRARITDGFRRIMNGTFAISALAVAEIPRTARGKYRYVLQNIRSIEDYVFRQNGDP